MRKIIYTFLFLPFLFACSHLTEPASEVSLQGVFKEFLVLADLEKFDEAKKMLIQKGSDELTVDITKAQIAAYFSMISSLRGVFVDQSRVFEKADKYEGCLTASGFLDDQPSTVNVSFVMEKGVWKIALIHMVYHANVSEFSTKATCPEKE